MSAAYPVAIDELIRSNFTKQDYNVTIKFYEQTKDQSYSMSALAFIFELLDI